jgi:hypothetical protein
MTDELEPGPQGDGVINFSVAWPDNVGYQSVPVNQFVFSGDQGYQDTVFMYLGVVAPPPWLSQDVSEERGKALGYVLPVEPRGAFTMGRGRAMELWVILGQHLGMLPPGGPQPDETDADATEAT